MQRLNLKITRVFMLIVAVLELAFCQVHIKAITVMFERRLGFYMFLFILFGLLLVFLLSSLKSLDASSVFKIIITAVVASCSAAYCISFMLNDFKVHDVIKLEDFRLSIIMLITGIIFYTIGSLLIVFNSLIKRREAES